MSNNVNNSKDQMKELTSIVKELIKSIHNAENFEGLKVSLTDKFGNMIKNNASAPVNNTPRNNTVGNNTTTGNNTVGNNTATTNANKPMNNQQTVGGKKSNKKRSGK